MYVYTIYTVYVLGGGDGQGNTNRGWQIVDPNISFLFYCDFNNFPYSDFVYVWGGGVVRPELDRVKFQAASF